MDMSAFTQFISTVGFPIAVAVYLLIANDKMRKTLEDNTKVIAELKTIMTMYVKDMEKEVRDE